MTGSELNIGVLASHEGTTLQAVIDACAAGAINGRVSVVIGNNSESGALTRALQSGITAAHLSSSTHPDPIVLDAGIRDVLDEHDVDVVLLAGYMRKLGPLTLARFTGRIINTHPALLPRFGGQGMYGDRVHAVVLASGDAESGASIHLVDANYDTGMVIAQRKVLVFAGDTVETLGRRVRECERNLVVELLADVAGGRRSLVPNEGGDA